MPPFNYVLALQKLYRHSYLPSVCEQTSLTCRNRGAPDASLVIWLSISSMVAASQDSLARSEWKRNGKRL